MKHLFLLLAFCLISLSTCYAQTNRGRIQAQGKNLEKSKSWTQNSNFTKNEAIEKLDALWNELSSTQKKDRKAAYDKAKKYILNAPKSGYCNTNGKISKTFQAPQRKDSSARIDIEIIKGYIK